MLFQTKWRSIPVSREHWFTLTLINTWLQPGDNGFASSLKPFERFPVLIFPTAHRAEAWCQWDQCELLELERSDVISISLIPMANGLFRAGQFHEIRAFWRVNDGGA